MRFTRCTSSRLKMLSRPKRTLLPGEQRASSWSTLPTSKIEIVVARSGKGFFACMKYAASQKRRYPSVSERLLSQVYITCSKSSVVTTVYNALFTAAPTAKLAKLPAARPATRQNEASVAATSLSSASIRGLRSGDDDTTIQSDPRYLAYKLTQAFIFLIKKERHTRRSWRTKGWSKSTKCQN